MFGATSPSKPQQSFYVDCTPGHSDPTSLEDYGLDFYDGLVAPFPSRAPSPIAFETFDPSRVYEDIFGFQGFPEEESLNHRAQERHQQQQQQQQHLGKNLVSIPTPDCLEKLRDLANIKTELPDLSSPESSSETSPKADPSHLIAQLLELPSFLPDSQAAIAKRVRKPSQKALANIGRSGASMTPSTVSPPPSMIMRLLSAPAGGEPLSPPSPTGEGAKRDLSSIIPALISAAQITPNATPLPSPSVQPLTTAPIPPIQLLPSAFSAFSTPSVSPKAALQPPRDTSSPTLSIDPSTILAQFATTLPISLEPVVKGKRGPKKGTPRASPDPVPTKKAGPGRKKRQLEEDEIVVSPPDSPEPSNRARSSKRSR